MKILLIHKFHYMLGGTETFHYNLAEALTAAGHEVIFFSMYDERNIPCAQDKYFVSNVDYNDPNLSTFKKIKMGIKLIYSFEWIKKNIDIEKAWEYHRYCFNRSIIDGLVRSNMILEYNETYKECVSNLRKNIFLPLKMEKSIKKKIMWCCYFISPRLMAIRKAIGFKKAAKTGGGYKK